MGITTSELAYMRESIELLMPDTCNICTLTNSPDGEGGVTVSRGTSGTSIPCRLDVETGREQVTGGAVQPYITYKMSLPYNTTIDEQNIIEHNSIDYHVKSVNQSQSWIAVRRVELERLP